MSDRLLDRINDYVLTYEDLNVGDTFTTSARTVTEADVVNFAGLSADYNSLHVDAEFAGTTPHGGRIAHGLLVLAITSGLCTRLPLMKFLEPSILGLANLECKFRLPCKIGYQYLRIETRGKVLPCCIANYPVAKLEGQSLAEIWFSHALHAFRQKMEKTPTERFHRKEKEWAFCQQCIHLHINRAVSARQGFLAP